MIAEDQARGSSIGVVGPAQVGEGELRRAFELLLSDPSLRQVIYLGLDDAAQRVVDAWADERLSQEQFIVKGAELACSGEPGQIDALLEEERAARRLQIVRRLPDPPARAIEMFDSWIVLAVHDKAVLDEDDIANAHIIVYGKADEVDFKRFGPRCFFTPGPVHKGVVGRLEVTGQGKVEIRALDLDGNTVLQQDVHTMTAKMVVTP